MAYSNKQIQTTIDYIINDAFDKQDPKNKRYISTILEQRLKTLLKKNRREMKFVIAQNQPLFYDFFKWLENNHIHFPLKYCYVLKNNGASIAVHSHSIICNPPKQRPKYPGLLNDITDGLREFHLNKQMIKNAKNVKKDNDFEDFTYSQDPYNPKDDFDQYESYLTSQYEEEVDDENPQSIQDQDTDFYSSGSNTDLYKEFLQRQEYDFNTYSDEDLTSDEDPNFDENSNPNQPDNPNKNYKLHQQDPFEQNDYKWPENFKPSKGKSPRPLHFSTKNEKYPTFLPAYNKKWMKKNESPIETTKTKNNNNLKIR